MNFGSILLLVAFLGIASITGYQIYTRIRAGLHVDPLDIWMTVLCIGCAVVFYVTA